MWNIRSGFLTKLTVIISLTIPVTIGIGIQPAQANHKKIAAIAGLIIGGAIVHNHYKKRLKYKHHNFHHYSYGINPYYYHHAPRYHKRVYLKPHYHNYWRHHKFSKRGR